MKSSGMAPTMGALAERTRASWARHIPTYAAVPPAYRAFFEPLQAAGQDLPHAVLAPSYEGFLHRATEKLVFALGQEIHVLEKAGNTFQAHCFPLPAISYVEFRAVLLDAHVKICGLADRGTPACCTIRFNAVGDYLFRPIVETIRRAAIGAGDAETGSTSMRVDAGLDTGPILAQRAIPIAPRETGQGLHDRLAALGRELLLETLPAYLAGALSPRPQPDDESLVNLSLIHI